MAGRQILEKDGLYPMDHPITKTALTNLNSFHDSEKVDCQIFFQESQSQPISPPHPQPTASQTKKQFSEQIFDVMTMFQNSPSTCFVENETPMENEVQESPTFVQTVQSDYEVEESKDDSEYVQSKENKSKKIEKPEKKMRNKKMDKEKNIFPNIAKRTAKIMFQDCRSLTEKYFLKRNINFQAFEEEYGSLLGSNCSGLALSSYFTEKEGDKKEMSRYFMRLFEKYLRKRYMVLAMKRGKMEDLETYITLKNRQLMYFSKYVNPQLRA